MKHEVTDFDPAEYLDNDEMIAGYLSDALETQDPAFIADAIGIVARAKGMKRVAEDAGVSRESLYRALSANGNPEFGTVLKVLASLNINDLPTHYFINYYNNLRGREGWVPDPSATPLSCSLAFGKALKNTSFLVFLAEVVPVCWTAWQLV